MNGATGYERLPGKGRRLLGPELLLLGDDHLLLARRQAYFESYQRFFFTDIQALTLRATSTREIAAAILATLLLLLAWAAWTADSTALRIVWSSLGVATLLASAVNWFLGPTIRCHLTTALQTVELTPLRRRRRALRVIERIKTRILEAQSDPATTGAAPAPAVEAAGDDGAASQSEAEPPPAPLRARADPPPLPAVYDGRWHRLLFSLLLVDSTVTYWQLQTDAVISDVVGGSLFLLEVAVAFTAVLRQRVVVVAPAVKRMTWVAVAFMLGMLVATWVINVYAGFAAAFQAASSGGAVDPLATQTQIEPLSRLSLVGTTAIGLAGLAVMRADSRRRSSDLG